jgi:hypothetical protein
LVYIFEKFPPEKNLATLLLTAGFLATASLKAYLHGK